jgi:hypothetical protein
MRLKLLYLMIALEIGKQQTAYQSIFSLGQSE